MNNQNKFIGIRQTRAFGHFGLITNLPEIQTRIENNTHKLNFDEKHYITPLSRWQAKKAYHPQRTARGHSPRAAFSTPNPLVPVLPK